MPIIKRKAAFFAKFWMQLNCILFAVQLLANVKLSNSAL